jgi:flavodoxin
MLVQQLKQLQDKLKKLKSQKIISKEDAEEIKRIEKWFEKLYEEDL